jgi:hypothetical protein
MDAANADGGTGGGGTSALTSGGQASEGTAPAGQSGTASGTSGQAAPINSGNNTEGNGTADWRSSLPKELQDNASLKKFTSLSALASGYVNAEKLIGSEKIVVPSKHATEDDWMGVYKKLGLPADVKEYLIDLPEEVLPKEKAAEMAQVFHKQGILPKQAKAMLEHFVTTGKATAEEATKQREKYYADSLSGLQKEWGQAYDQNMSRAKQALQKFGDADLIKMLDQGIGNEPAVIKFFAKVGETLKEGSLVNGGPAQSGAYSPAQAKAEIGKIQGDNSHPYHIKAHPNHAAAVKEMADLFNAAYTTKN